MTPINAQNIQAGKKAPNSSYEGAPAREQPVSMQPARAGGITLSVVKRLIRSKRLRAATAQGARGQPTHQFVEYAGEATQSGQQVFHLRTALFTVHTPLAEVLAVVAQ